MMKQLLITAICLFSYSAFSQMDSCTLAASYTYSIDGSTIYFTNTTTGGSGPFIYDWTVGDLTSGDYSPSFPTVDLEDSTEACLTVIDVAGCVDTYCGFIFFEADTMIVEDSLDCDLSANFTYSIDGSTINFTNTSTDEPAWPFYTWTVDGMTSYDENPSFSTAGFEESEFVCLTVNDSLEECFDIYCTTIFFEEDSVIVDDSLECELEASFTFTIDDDFIYFTNTSTGEPIDAAYSWYFEGAPSPTSTEENPTLSTDGLPLYMSVTFTVHDSLYDCIDSYLLTITTALTDCDELVADFSYEIDGDNVILTNTSTGEGLDANYDWYFNETSYTGETVTVPASDFEGDELICLTVSDSFCVDTVCYSYYFELDSSDCDLSANFTYSIDGTNVNFTNTSTDEPAWPFYTWTINGLTSSDENPSFSTIGFDATEEACLIVSDSLGECIDTYCTTIIFVEDSTECTLETSFSYARSDETIYFTNTSTGEPIDAQYLWWIDGSVASTEENPSFPVTDFEPEKWICLEVFDTLFNCYDSLCVLINIDSIAIDSTASIEDLEKLTVDIYPNPANDVINISIRNTNGNQQIVIVNALGEIVRMEAVGINSSLISIAISDLPNGFYIVNIIDEANPARNIQQKLIKN